jgi:hypothetical protein
MRTEEVSMPYPNALYALAREIEAIAGADPCRAAELLQRLACELRRSTQRSAHLPAIPADSLRDFTAMSDDVAARLRGGQIRSLCGLEHHVRRLLADLNRTRDR